MKLADEIRTESRDAVDALHARNVQVVMITGDAEAVAASVAAELGIDRYFAGVRPEDKSEKVKQLQAEGRPVAMVGDGVNDAPALAQADVGIAIGAGTDVAIASAGVILASDDPRSVLSVIELSRASYRKMKQNLWWAAGYNLISVPLAAGVLAPIGFVMPMSLGAILMSVSTIVVALNAQLLRRLDLRPDTIVPSSTGGPRPIEAPTPTTRATTDSSETALEGFTVTTSTDTDTAAEHAHHGYITDKKRYLDRLKRIEGQARGISRMIDDEKYCIDILTQISAVTSALETVALGLLDDHLRHCVADAARAGGPDADAKITEASQAIARLVRS